jgi:hypothetical protein
VAMVPTHPLDKGTKTPLNLAHVMPLTSTSSAPQASAGAKWKVVKEAPAQALVSHASPTTVPARTTRMLNASGQTNGSIAYDPKEHRFVNSNVNAGAAATTSPAIAAKTSSVSAPPARSIAVDRQVRGAPTASSRAMAPSASSRVAAPSASSRVAAPPPAPRSYGSSRGGFEGGSVGRGGSSQMGTATRSSSTSVSSGSRGASSSGGGRSH